MRTWVGRMRRRGAAFGLALALCAAYRTVDGAFSTTLHGSPSETIQPGTPGAFPRGRDPAPRPAAHLAVRAFPLLVSHVGPARAPTAGAATMTLQPWLTNYDPDAVCNDGSPAGTRRCDGCSPG